MIKALPKILKYGSIGIAAIAALMLLLTFPIMWLWNWLMPEIFGLPAIGVWHALGLLVLCHVLFSRS